LLRLVQRLLRAGVGRLQALLGALVYIFNCVGVLRRLGVELVYVVDQRRSLLPHILFRGAAASHKQRGAQGADQQRARTVEGSVGGEHGQPPLALMHGGGQSWPHCSARAYLRFMMVSRRRVRAAPPARGKIYLQWIWSRSRVSSLLHPASTSSKTPKARSSTSARPRTCARASAPTFCRRAGPTPRPVRSSAKPPSSKVLWWTQRPKPSPSRTPSSRSTSPVSISC